MNKLYNYYFAAKAWWAGVVTALTAFIEAGYAMISDEAISLKEAEGMVMLGVAVIGALAAFRTVWQVRNEGAVTNG